MTLTKSKVLAVNSKHAVVNWLTNYVWHGKPLEDSIRGTVNYYSDMRDVLIDIDQTEVKARLKKYVQGLTTFDGFNKFIEELKQTNISNSYVKLMIILEIYDRFQTKLQLQNFIEAEMIPAVEAIL